MSADAKDEEAPVDPFEPEGMGIPIDKTTTKFHGKEEKDYLGRSWIVHPSDVQPVDNPKCYLPNKCIHKWYGVWWRRDVQDRPHGRRAVHRVLPHLRPSAAVRLHGHQGRRLRGDSRVGQDLGRVQQAQCEANVGAGGETHA